MKSLLIIAAAAFSLAACNQSDLNKLTHDAKSTGKAVGQTASDALDAAKNTTDNVAADAKKAADSDTAKNLANKANDVANKVVDKTKQVAHDAKDAATPAPKPNSNQNPQQ
jgi:hypothetical protein